MLKMLIGCAMLLVIAQAHAERRIEHIGPVAHDELVVSTVDMQADLMMAARTIFPSAWSGFAQKTVDVHKDSKLRLKAGELWVAALDRWLEQEQMNARLDWSSHKFYLLKSASTDVQERATESTAKSPLINAAKAEVKNGGPVRVWSILTADVRLEVTFERWAREGGYKVVWDADRHILISAADQFNGTIAEAINRVLMSPAIRDSDYPLEAVFYANNPPVIRITRLGDQPIKE